MEKGASSGVRAIRKSKKSNEVSMQWQLDAHFGGKIAKMQEELDRFTKR